MALVQGAINPTKAEKKRLKMQQKTNKFRLEAIFKSIFFFLYFSKLSKIYFILN
jgi:hypothetical protein